MRSQSLPQDLAPDLSFRILGRLGAGLMRLWGATLSIDWVGTENRCAVEREEGRVLYAFWHGQILPLVYCHRERGIVTLVSRSKDGEIISQILSGLGLGVVRGSSTRGGMRGLLEMVRIGRQGYPLAVTPDGPKGPSHLLQGGVLHIAHRSRLPIVPLAVEAVRRTELSSWDRFMIPHPWSRLAVVVGSMIRIPPEADSRTLESVWGMKLTEALMEVEEQAAAWRAERTTGR